MSANEKNYLYFTVKQQLINKIGVTDFLSLTLFTFFI